LAFAGILACLGSIIGALGGASLLRFGGGFALRAGRRFVARFAFYADGRGRRWRSGLAARLAGFDHG
jgi:hypothetical protein